MASPMEQDSNLEISEKNCEGKLTSVESLLSQKSEGGWGLAKNYHFSNNPFPNKLYVPFRSMRWIISSGWNDSVRIFVTEWPTRERICERTCQRIKKSRHWEISQRQLAFKYTSCVSKLDILKKPNWQKERRRLFSKRGRVEFWLARETNPANGQSEDWNKEHPH